MNYQKKSVRDIDVKGKKVLLRCDFNVPTKNGVITSDKRIVAALPTIKYLLENGAAVIACSHMGKPNATFDSFVKKQTEKGADPATLTEDAWKKSLKKLSLKPVAERLSELLGQEVKMASDVCGESAQALAAELKPGEIMLLENTRFEKGETKNDPELSKKLASLADIFVSDAFGTVHRAHATTAGVTEYLPAVCGFLIEKEIGIMGKALADPERPFVAILGGAKVSDKLNVISNLLEKVDTLIIGGGMAYTFLAAKGYTVGTSLLDSEKLDYCREMMKKAEEKGVKLLLPVDTVVSKSFPDPIDGPVEVCTVDSDKIPADLMGLDIGEKTRELFADAVKSAKTVVWNGPMGVFENPTLAKGTIAVAQALADSEAITIVGGGDSAAACEQLGFADKITHISTGGGASLEFLEGKELPGVAALLDK
ncbi:MAG: phosphoglycerate kinase [Oscillospiraceae bacterium]|nr:phosphoglycerate kinase [Oscillospiraceae bacterium]MBR1841741.1 phosphoglycerate kinase [Oscillospiraceae bacterium]